jgi:hypothetical protein
MSSSPQMRYIIDLALHTLSLFYSLSLSLPRMSLPTQKFEKLSINPGMPPTTRGQSMRALSDGHPLTAGTGGVGEIALDKALSETTLLDSAALQQRAFDVRDMLSTFDRVEFPTEYIDGVTYRRIGILEEPKPLEDCIVKEDLKNTMFQLAVNCSIVYWIFRQLLPEELCAQYYAQKFNRRVKSQFDLFDKISTDPKDGVDPAGEAEDEVEQIATDLRRIVDNARIDREQRKHGDSMMAANLVDMLKDVCVRKERASLFQALIGNPTTHEPKFGLDALEALPKAAISEQSSGLDNVKRLLIENDAPPEYRRAFDEMRRILPVEVADEPASSLKRPATSNGRGKQKRPNRT